MKISWGHKILFVYLGFVIFILFLAYKASQEKFDLVRTDYYDAELKFQNVIDEKQRTAALSAPPVITHTADKVGIQLPGEFLRKEVKGTLMLYRPSDASKDVKKEFTIRKDGSVEVRLDNEPAGAYEVKLYWEAGGKTFYYEQRIFF